jgi:hypothetical protein
MVDTMENNPLLLDTEINTIDSGSKGILLNVFKLKR